MLQLITQNWNFVAAAALLAIVLVPKLWPSIKGSLPALGKLIGGDGDAADLAALKRLRARYKRVACQECTDALATLSKHFLDEVAS